MRHFRKIKRKGFTLVESILCIVIIAVIASVAAKVLIVGLDVYSLIVNRNNAFQTARFAMERMVDEIVLIHSYDITGMGNTSFSFFDLDGSATNFHKGTYTRPGKSVPSLIRGSDFLAGEVTSLDFDYYKGDGTVAYWSWQVRRINIEFTVTALAKAGSVHLKTDVFPRNYMYSNFQ